MNCREAVRLVEKLADGEASTAEAREVRTHVERCEDCRAHDTFVRALVETAGEVSYEPPPEAYWQHFPSKVMARLDEAPAPSAGFWQRFFSPGVLRFGAAAATLTVVIAVGWRVLDDGALEPPESRQSAAGGAAGDRPVESREEGRRGLSNAEGEVLVGAVEPSGVESPAAEAPAMSRDERLDAAAPAARRAPAPETPASSNERASRAREMADDAAPALAIEATRLAEAQAPAEPETDPSAPSAAERPSLASQVAEAPQQSRASSAVRSEREADTEHRFAAAGVYAETTGDTTPDCATWRSYLEENGDDGRNSLEARYEVAKCALEEYEEDPTPKTRQTALDAIDAFLERESEGPRANSMRALRNHLN